MNLPNFFYRYKIHLSSTMFNNISYQIQMIMPPKLKLNTLTRRFGRFLSRNLCNSPTSLKNGKPTHQNKSEYPQIKHFPFGYPRAWLCTLTFNANFRMHYSLSCLECNRNSGARFRLHSKQDKMQSNNKFPFSLFLRTEQAL